MNLDGNKVESIIIDVLKELNEGLPDEKKFEVSNHTILFGRESQIDSLSLVTVIVEIESILSENGFDVFLTDDKAMTREQSPFKSVKTLKEYILELI